MRFDYVAYGLQLSSSFELPGMRLADVKALPRVTLELTTPLLLLGQWDDDRAERLWQGCLGDREPLSIDLGADGDHLFTYGQRAVYRLTADGTRLQCAPSAEGLAWQRALLSKVLANVSLLRGYEQLHAGAVISPDGVVAILAPSGMGKTTLALALADAGWPLLSDDILALDRDGEAVTAHPGTSHVNLDPDGERGRPRQPDLPVIGEIDGELWALAPAVDPLPRSISAVCLLERGPSLPANVELLVSTPLSLSPFMLGLSDGPDRERHRFELYSELARSARLIRVQADEAEPAAAVAQRLRTFLGQVSPAPVGAIA